MSTVKSTIAFFENASLEEVVAAMEDKVEEIMAIEENTDELHACYMVIPLEETAQMFIMNEDLKRQMRNRANQLCRQHGLYVQFNADTESIKIKKFGRVIYTVRYTEM